MIAVVDDPSASVSPGLKLWLQRLNRRTHLSASDEAIVLGLPGRTVKVAPRRDFVRLGERVTAACVVVSGIAARFGQTSNGQRQLTALHIPGDAADLHSAVLPEAESALTALSEVTLYQVPHPAVHEAARQSPALARAFWRDCTVDASIAAEWLLSNGRRTAKARLAHLLCELVVRFEAIGADPARVDLGMTQTHLADSLGLTGVHVNRMLRELREDGAVVLRETVAMILDRPLLERLGEFDPAYLHLRREGPDIGRAVMGDVDLVSSTRT